MSKVSFFLLAIVVSLISDFARAKRIEIPPITEEHPRLLLKQSDLVTIKQRVNQREEPWYSNWAVLKSNIDDHIEKGKKPNPYTGDDNRVGFFPACREDSGYARDLAMAYWITGEKKYADESLKMLLGWAQNAPLPGADFDPNISYPALGMAVARGSLSFIWTYDLLYNYSGFTPEQKKVVENWFQLLLSHIKTGAKRWEENDYFDKQYYQNHAAAHTLGMAALGYALGDEELVRYALDSVDNSKDMLDLIEGCILMRGETPYYREPDFQVHDGEIYDRYRHFQMEGHYRDYVTKPNLGLRYSHLTLLLLTTAAEIAYNNGVDLYSYTAPSGENLELCFDFYADFFRLKDDSLRGGFYSGEKDCLTQEETGECLFELGHKHYPSNKAVKLLLQSADRIRGEVAILGKASLYFGQPLNCDK
ncbi:MAG: hypothetical protein A2Y10_17625 [Planctomycetes bacterium GWF2_41_51]|nr:MAG: hypothetical protein A2Y10_17625 [Planctomycetes bacterium GWF2_41_51]HBG28047.1 hypothetical protein [Phycisphaerales bacterium]